MRIDSIFPARSHNPVEGRVEGGRAINATSFREALAEARGHAGLDAASVPDTWSARDAEAFAVFVEANRRTESGGTATFSTLRTTAGADHRASYGVAQLSIREHLSRLARLGDAELARLGTSRTEIDAMRARGEAAVSYYHLVVDGRDLEASRATLGMGSARAHEIMRLAADGDTSALRAAIGRDFEASTGLPPAAIDDLMTTRALRDPALRDAFAAQYEHDHGVAFDPTHRDGTAMAETMRHLALTSPELEHAVALLGGDDAAATSAAHYLGVGDSAENLLGWHARAARSACGDARFEPLLERIDGVTSGAREVEDFERALAAVARVPDLDGEARVATLARLGRIFHGSPTRAREALFVDGRLDAPRCQSRADLDALLDDLRSGRRWSDARLAEHVADVVAERGVT